MSFLLVHLPLRTDNLYGLFTQCFRIDTTDPILSVTHDRMHEYARTTFGLGVDLDEYLKMTPDFQDIYRWGYLYQMFFYFRNDADAMLFKLAMTP